MSIKKKKKLKKSTDELSLPIERSRILENLQDYSTLIYGQKKIGKTSLCAQFPETLFLMFEPGGKSLSIYQKPVRNWKSFKGYIDLILKDTRFKTIIVDTADRSYELCTDYVCDKMVIEHPSDEAYGKGWQAVKKEYTSQVSRLLHSGKGVIFTSHTKNATFKTRKSEETHKITSSMSTQAKDVLEGLIDIWINYDYDGKRRCLTIQGTEEVDAGHRLRNHFKYADGSAIEKIFMGKSPEEAYQNLVTAFNNNMKGEKSVKNKSGKKKTLKFKKIK